MRKDELRFIQETCSDIRAQTGADSDGWAEEIQADITSMLDEVERAQRGADSVLRKKALPLVTSFDLALVVMCDLTLAVSEMQDEPHPIIWPELQMADPEGTKPSYLFLLLMTNLTNTLLALRTLLRAGLDYQARVLLRSFIELADVTVIALYDVDFFKCVRTPAETFQDARRWWSKHLNRSSIKEQYKKMLDELGAPAEWRESFLAGLQDTYDWLSQWTHNNIIALSIGAMPREIGGERCRYGLGGRAGAASQATLEVALDYVMLFLYMATSLLQRMHGWNLHSERLFRSCRWFGVLQVMYARLRGAPEFLDLSRRTRGNRDLTAEETEFLEAYRELDDHWKWSYSVAIGRLALYQHSRRLRTPEGRDPAEAASEFLCINLLELQGVTIRLDERGKPYVDSNQLARLLAAKSERDQYHIKRLVKQLERGRYEGDA